MSGSKVEYNLQDQPGLWLIHEPQAPLRVVCDIIAVHGLSGGAASTWTHPRNQNLWLRDCLPNLVTDVENRTSARIWSFGYNANTVFSAPVAGISDFTRSLLGYLEGNGINNEGRKVIFIAHSLGGVVVKSALIDSGRHGSQHRWLLDATVGIVFLGTPHQGSKLGNRGAYMAKIARYAGIKANSQLLDSLKRNSGELFDKAEQFRDVCPGILLCSFYEQLPLSGAKMIVVDKNSAFIGVSGEEFLPLNADHRGICKFESPEDQNWRLVRAKIIKMLEQVSSSRGEPEQMILPTISGGRGNTVRENTVTSGNGQNQRPPPQGWRNYQYASVSSEEDSNLETRYSESDSRPPPTDSQQSFDSHPPYVQRQRQASRTPGGSTFSPERGRTPSSQGDQNQQSQSPNHSRSRSTSDHYGPQMQSFPSMQSLSSQSSRHDHLGSMDSTYLYPPSSMYSLSAEQLRETSRQTSPTPARKPLPPSEPAAWYCDVCVQPKSATQARFHCTVCNDYDLCVKCHMEGQVNKSHSTGHKLLSISMRHTIHVGAITPCYDNVTPQFSPPRTQVNWTHEGENRWLHLRNSPSHGRYIVRRLSPGAYRMQLVIKFKFSDHVDMDTFRRAKEIGFGEIKIASGSPLNTSIFLNQQRTEDATLPQQLFGADASRTADLMVPDHVVNPMEHWELVFDLYPTTVYIGMEHGVNPANAILGVLLQWSNVLEFQSSENPVLIMSLDQILLDELLEYDEPPRHSTPLPTPSQNSVAARTTTATATAPTTTATATGDDDDDDDDDDNDVTLQEITDAAQLLVKKGYPVTSDNLAGVIATTREIETGIQTMLLLGQIQQIRERQRRAQQQADTVKELLLLGWLLSD